MSKRRKRVMWAIGIIIVLALAAFFALQYAIARNGPAVLDTVDRLTGGDRGTQLLVRDSFGGASAQKIAVYGPVDAADAKRPVILFVHGGSWRSGDPDDYGFLARAFVPEGFVVALAGYRLNPEVEFPAMLEDTAGALAWTKRNIARYGGDPDAIFLAGHSAGAYNVVMTTLDRQWLTREGLSDTDIAGVIGLAGPYDFFPFDSDSTRASFGGAPDPGRSTQPIAFARADAPPMLLMTGDEDDVVKPRNSRVLSEKLDELGAPVEYRVIPGYDHYDIITRTASPWRSDERVIVAIRNFISRVAAEQPGSEATSFPVQGESR